MAVEFNHTIVRVKDKHASAALYADLLGLEPATPYGPFQVLQMSNGVSLDFADTEGEPTRAHYAFLVAEADFDDILGRIRERDIAHWADPFQKQPGEINHEDGGRGVYWEDPDGYFLEMITRPYGSSS